MDSFDCLVIVGPTASGKTALSLEVAERLEGEIVSMDSRQVYRRMDVGTAKATPEERRRVEHHGLDLVDPAERFSAGAFVRYVRPMLSEIRGRGRTPVLVGGTGFFLRALTHPIFQEPPLDPERRARLHARFVAMDTEALHRWLRELDPEAADRLRDWGGRQRILRALEVPLLTGRSLGWWQRNSPAAEEPLRPLVFVLDLPRELLFARIDRRVAEMVEQGLLEEVRALAQSGYDEHTPGLRAHGYQEIVPYLRGEIPLETALDEVRRATRAYAKRQQTWFRTQLPESATRLDARRPTAELADEIVRGWREAEPA
jgi:tRNA dimethylallyltransferase